MLSDSDAVARDQSAAGRLEFWYVGWKLIQDKPLIGMPTDYLMQNRFWAHNFFLEQWVAAGLLGLVGAIVFVGSTFRAAFRLVDVKDNGVFVVGICSTAIFVGFLIQAQFSFSTFHAKMMFLAAGMIISLDRALERRSAQIKTRQVSLPGPAAAE
jgi:O-antigen ligase